MDGKTVLVVESHEDFRFLLRAVLSNAGYAVEETRNGLEALQYLDSHRLPDLIVTELAMPVMGGVEFCAVRDGDSRLQRIPLLVYSGDPYAASIARRIHANACVSKFASPYELVAEVRHYLH